MGTVHRLKGSTLSIKGVSTYIYKPHKKLADSARVRTVHGLNKLSLLYKGLNKNLGTPHDGECSPVERIGIIYKRG